MSAAEVELHRHGPLTHAHSHAGPHRHLGRAWRRSMPGASLGTQRADREESQPHSHGLIEPSIKRSREGLGAVSRSLAEQSRTIRLPVHVIEQLTKLYNTQRDLHHELGRPPTPEEIGERMDIDPQRVRDAFRAAKVPISLETPVGAEDQATIADLIADADARAPAEEAEEQVLASSLEEALHRHLTEREADVVKLRFGLGDGRERTLSEVGQALGMSRERARQIEVEAMRKLRRATPFLAQFREYAS